MSRYTNSPSSSLRDESVQNTPYTTLTAFSPEDVRLQQSSTSRSGMGPPTTQSDPFVTSDKSKAEQKLSATASTFQPFGMRGSSMVPTSLSSSPVPGTTQYLDAVIEKATSSPKGDPEMGFGTFTTNTMMTRNIKVSSIMKNEVMPLIETTWKKLHKAGNSVRGSFKFRDIGDTVYIRLGNISDAPTVYNALSKDHDNIAVEYVSINTINKGLSPQQEFSSAHEGQVALRVKYPTGRSSNKLQFEKSIRDLLSVEGPIVAWQKMAAVEAGVFHLIAEFNDSAHALRAMQRINGMNLGDAVDPSIISITFNEPDRSSTLSAQRAKPTMTPTRRSGPSENQAALIGGMGNMSIGSGQVPQAHTISGFSTTTSPLSYGMGNPGFNMPPGPLPLAMNSMYSPVSIGHNSQQCGAASLAQYQPPPFFQQGYSPSTMVSYTPRMYGQQYTSPSRFYDQRMPQSARDHTYYHPRGDGRFEMARYGYGGNRQFGPRNSRQNQAAGQHNHVDIERIRAGIDVRTTVMLRNIPNKVDQAMLKEIVDESSFGKYDFMYLRIDFSNNCNVGYAFINFHDPLDIIKFVELRSNQKWQRFRSEKVAEVSYATIQGRDCLIQKFRNSSVMLEPEHYRPKLFFILQDGDELAGKEEPFPPSDNASKLKRSCENAEHVGLFAPSAGQQFRDEQRRRRSQYDRGTSLAERDEYYDESLYLGFPNCNRSAGIGL
ncbi:related to mei2 protein [Rhynchosporium secalis]|uniref:Related to mei2 protein n=1 Tax=Rhynchosporium secalis TaxID=38038 RepID=A0A1E1MBD3_RHYSE|nr:related to mei2 protein [Rhynchosporium secalis]